MKRLLLGAIVGMALVACEDNARRTGMDRTRDTTADRESVAGREVDTSTRNTTMRDDMQADTTTNTGQANARYRVSKIDRDKNEVTLTPVENAETRTATDVQPTAGREMTMPFDEFKSKAVFTGDINALKEGQEVTLKETAPGTAPADIQKNETETETKGDTNTKTY